VSENFKEALTFEDVLLVPQKSDVLPSQVDVTTRITRNIRLKIPIVSASMDTVTESRLAIAIAQLGGLGIIHRNATPEDQADEIDKVKRSESGMIVDPITIGADRPIADALALMSKYRISGVPITEGGRLLGILTNRDLRFETRVDLPISEVMTKENLITVPVGTTLDEARALLHKHRVEKLLVVDEDYLLKGLITVKDIQKAMKYPNSAKDELGRLLVGAAIGVGDEALERAKLSGGGGGDEGEKGETIDKLTYALGNEIGPLVVQRVEFVGPRVGSELRSDGLMSLAVACVLILMYIAFRFSARFAPGAIIALVHDIGITAGIFVILGLEFDLRVLAALLAILGYSLNDTIIIYDRIRENMKLRTKFDLVDVLNQSVNQTLARTVLTSGTTMAVVLSLWIFGGEVIRPFAIAMAIGIVIGTYSSVFIAAPTLLLLEQRFGGAPASVAAPAAGAGAAAAEVAPDAAFAVRHDAPSRRDAGSNKARRKKKKRR